MIQYKNKDWYLFRWKILTYNSLYKRNSLLFDGYRLVHYYRVYVGVPVYRVTRKMGLNVFFSLFFAQLLATYICNPFLWWGGWFELIIFILANFGYVYILVLSHISKKHFRRYLMMMKKIEKELEKRLSDEDKRTNKDEKISLN